MSFLWNDNVLIHYIMIESLRSIDFREGVRVGVGCEFREVFSPTVDLHETKLPNFNLVSDAISSIPSMPLEQVLGVQSSFQLDITGSTYKNPGNCFSSFLSNVYFIE